MSYHIEKALKLADEYEKNGNKELANKFFKIAEKYEKLLKEVKNKNEKRKQKELYN